MVGRHGRSSRRRGGRGRWPFFAVAGPLALRCRHGFRHVELRRMGRIPMLIAQEAARLWAVAMEVVSVSLGRSSFGPLGLGSHLKRRPLEQGPVVVDLMQADVRTQTSPGVCALSSLGLVALCSHGIPAPSSERTGRPLLCDAAWTETKHVRRSPGRFQSRLVDVARVHAVRRLAAHKQFRSAPSPLMAAKVACMSALRRWTSWPTSPRKLRWCANSLHVQGVAASAERCAARAVATDDGPLEARREIAVVLRRRLGRGVTARLARPPCAPWRPPHGQRARQVETMCGPPQSWQG